MTLYKRSLKGSCAPTSGFSGLQCAGIDETSVEEYTGKVISAQNHQLDPLKYDLAEWINKTLGGPYVTGSNFFQDLDNGAVLCYLAQVITTRARIAINAGLTKSALPKISKKYFDNAMSGSFFSRDNTENFINFCRSISVHENLLFESDDLVLHYNPRNVILCLLEVARLATHYGVEPPNLIQLEREMTKEEQGLLCESEMNWPFHSLPANFETDTQRSSPTPPTTEKAVAKWNVKQLTAYEIRSIDANETTFCLLPPPTPAVASNIDTLTDRCAAKTTDIPIVCFDAKLINDSNKAFDDLDKKVEQIARFVSLNCRCANRRFAKLKIRKIGEGRYNVAGRNIYVRLLKQQMMVRVGGGWDTLDHFLQKYDPCQADGREFKTIVRPSSANPNLAKKFTYYTSFKKILRPGESAI